MTRRRIVSVARDQGSIQAIAPVLRAIQNRGDVDLQPLAFEPGARLYVDLGIRPEGVDYGEFAADPRVFTRRILQRWQPDVVLLGSSVPKGPAPNTAEQYMTAECQDAGVPTVVVLDAWGYYAERFGGTPRVDPSVVPDVVCALDVACRDELERIGVPAERIRVTHNPWLDRVVASSDAGPGNRQDATLRVLFVSQPLVENREFRNWPYTQHELFLHVVDALRNVRAQRPVQLLMWLHPNENKEIWGGLLAVAPDLSPMICEKRGPDIYRDVDALVTSHSTLVYEALHLDLPCFHLRPGDPSWARNLPDALGLTPIAQDAEQLTELLLAIDDTSRERMRATRQRLSQQGVFFSDGHATDRVVATIYSTVRESGL